MQTASAAPMGLSVSDAVARRRSVRAFRPDPVPLAVVRDLVERAARAPSGGNLQPWRVHVLTGAPLERLKALVAERLQQTPGGEPTDYDIYPKGLWEPFRTRRFQAGEDLYATLGIGREDRLARLMHLAANFTLWGAPVGLFFSLDRRLGPPQWSDLGMYMQTLMLLAVEAGLDTCAQEAWSLWPRTVAEVLGLSDDQLLVAGMALGVADDTAPVNGLRTRRAPVEEFATFAGF